MSDIIKGAILISAAILVSVAAHIYFSPFQTCMRAEDDPTHCAWLSSGGRR